MFFENNGLSPAADNINITNNDNSNGRSGDYDCFEFPTLIRIAIYDNLKSIPRIIDIQADNVTQLINDISQKTYSFSHEMGGRIPYTIIREVVENLIHAYFKEVTISILNNGNHIIISDQGPGIQDKEKAFLPGYTSATKEMRKYIRGVGSGLPIVKETITFSGGRIDVSDNIRKGTVISLKLDSGEKDSKTIDSKISIFNTQNQGSFSHNYNYGSVKEAQDKNSHLEELLEYDLSLRQVKILFLILELGEAGPSRISKELGFSLSTTYRELVYLESEKFLTSNSSGKRKLSSKGIKYLEYYSSNF